LLRRKAVLLGQDTCLLSRSVAANVAYGLKLRGLPAAGAHRLGLGAGGASRARICRAQLAAAFRRRGPARGPGRQAGAFAPGALLDEPTAGLDRASVQHVKQAVLAARAEQGATLSSPATTWSG
jgi:tungstate transport system ATP-binding protein